MDTSEDNWNACLLYRNKQLTKQLKEYQEVSSLTGGASSLMVAMGQLMCLHQKPSYGIVKDESEWKNLFAVIDLFYGGCLSDELKPFPLGNQEIKVCYLLRARMCNKTIGLLFNVLPVSVIKAKQRIKNKIGLSGTDSLDKYIQQR
ncbi:MAG: helix-turn-helix transcriptional regulator [Bacteroides sp.]|nr:helix-turn-helix transcriptional regulator [Bacteroides sp.]